jgi:hypothetical protein
MDTHHLFTIPSWLPDTLPPELWAIIFHWKWRLEMKDIHTVLIEKLKYRYTQLVCEWDMFVKDRIIAGNRYGIYILNRLDERRFLKLSIIIPKCGIELLNKFFWCSPHISAKKRPFKGDKNIFRKYLSKNHGLVLPEIDPMANSPFTKEWNEDWKTLLNLLWSV